MGAATVRGAQEKGVLVYIKHYALNDQETNRMGVSIFANEQSIRDLYLKPFEITVREGDAHGAMVSMNRIGSKWSGAHSGLMTETLRNEWGFEGLAPAAARSYRSRRCGRWVYISLMSFSYWLHWRVRYLPHQLPSKAAKISWAQF